MEREVRVIKSKCFRFSRKIMNMNHITVLKKKSVDLLNIKDKGIFVDVTLGSGGHSLEILNRVENILLICFDLDSNNIENFREIVTKDKGINLLDLETVDATNIEGRNVILINKNFSEIGEYAKKIGVDKVDGVIADLGWSYDQFENIEGLSYEKNDDELDMRLGQGFGVKAKDLLNALNKKELSRMFEEYGDILGFQNRKLVMEILDYRRFKLFENVKDLNQVIERLSGSKIDKKYQSKVFQSLRIAVNNEKQNLKDFLESVKTLMKSGSRLCVITFHSGEEKVVMNELKGVVERKEAIFVSNQYGKVYFRPSVEELTANLRSRSAKLFSIEYK